VPPEVHAHDGATLARTLAHQLRDERSDLLTTAKVHLRRVAPFLGDVEHEHVVQQAVSQITRAGVLETWLANRSVKEVMVNGDGSVYIEDEHGVRQVHALNSHDTSVIIERILLPLSRRVDRQHPIVDARLDDGSRVCAIVPPASPLGPCLVIRRFVVANVALECFGDAEITGRLRAMIEDRVNVVVSGRASAGKTTLVNAMCRNISANERVVTIEDTLELDPGIANLVRLEAQPPSLEGRGEITHTSLMRAALRLRPDRLIVGEVRGAEVLDMLEALSTGHHGSLSTCHANSAQHAIERLATLVVRHHHGWSIHDAHRLVRASVGAVVHLERDDSGRRRVTEIHEVGQSA
jgi:pilus assembly protein CpaF